MQPNLQKSDTVITTVLVAPLVLYLLELWALLRLEERGNQLHALEWLRQHELREFVSLGMNTKYVIVLTSKSATTAINT